MTTNSSETHEATTDPSGLAIRCSCGSWSMLFRNSLGKDAETAHREHRESRARSAMIRLELIATGPVFVTGELIFEDGAGPPLTLSPTRWEALETALAEAARYPVPAVATDLLDMVTEALRPHLSLVEDQDECWEVTVEGASGLADIAIEALISAARLPGVADEHVMFEYRLARDQVARFAERVNAAEVERDAMRPVMEAARAWVARQRRYDGQTLTGTAANLIAAVDALDGAS